MCFNRFVWVPFDKLSISKNSYKYYVLILRNHVFQWFIRVQKCKDLLESKDLRIQTVQGVQNVQGV